MAATTRRSSVFYLQEAAYMNTVGVHNLMQATSSSSSSSSNSSNSVRELPPLLVPSVIDAHQRQNIRLVIETSPDRLAIHLALEAFQRSLNLLSALSAETMNYEATLNDNNLDITHTFVMPWHVLQSVQLPPSGSRSGKEVNAEDPWTTFFMVDRAQLFHFPESDPTMKELLTAPTSPCIACAPLSFYGSIVVFNIALAHHQLALRCPHTNTDAALNMAQQSYRDCLLILTRLAFVAHHDEPPIARLKLAALNNLGHAHFQLSNFERATRFLEWAQKLTPSVLLHDSFFPQSSANQTITAKDVEEILLNILLAAGRPSTAATA